MNESELHPWLHPPGGIHRSGRGDFSVRGSIGGFGNTFGEGFGGPEVPEFVVKALLEFGEPTSEGKLVRAVAVPWFEIAKMIQRDPQAIYDIDPRTWEEIIAGAYDRADFDEVILTPHSGDFGRDVIASKRGVGSIRILDQVKAYKPGHVVTAEEVRAMIGVITVDRNVSKGVVTTTSTFAPRISSDPSISPLIPYRLELKPRDVLLPWLDQLSGEQGADPK